MKDGTEFTLEVDTVIGTVGQFSDLSFLDSDFDNLEVDLDTLASEIPGLFVVGGHKTGASFIIAALSKSFMSVLGWGMVTLIILFIPTFGIMFPGAVTGWVKAIPSHYLVDTVHRASNFGAGWGDVWYNLVVLLGVDLILAWIGIMALRRRFR